MLSVFGDNGLNYFQGSKYNNISYELLLSYEAITPEIKAHINQKNKNE